MTICEIGSNVFLKWNIFGVQDDISFHKILYYKNDTKYDLLSILIRYNTTERYLHADYESPFDRSRISGYLRLDNGNGTLTVNITDIKYDDSGVFGFELISFYESHKEFFSNITLDVQSKYHFIFHTPGLPKIHKQCKIGSFCKNPHI